MVKSAELKPCYKQAVSETIWVLLSPFENTNLRYIFEFSLSAYAVWVYVENTDLEPYHD